MDVEVVKLWLNPSVLTTTTTNIGVRDSTFRNCTYFVDLRECLGETLYTKYDTFKVLITYPLAGLGVSELNTIFVEGLNLINASYQGKTASTNIAIAAQGSTAAATSSNIGKQTQTREFIMIKPNSNKITLTFSVIADNGATPNITNAVPVYFLTFAPIKKDVIYKNPWNLLYQNEQANFTLSTRILSAGATNQYGTMNSTMTNFTFTNVNMRRIIGTLWDKYDKFNLICASYGTGSVATSLSGNQRLQWFQISGLQFINTLSVLNTNMLSQGYATTPVFNPASSSTADAESFANPIGATTFRKPETENVDLTFQLWVQNNGGTVLNSQLNHFTLSFIVVGVKE
jgi:hypothetical protein